MQEESLVFFTGINYYYLYQMLFFKFGLSSWIVLYTYVLEKRGEGPL